MKTTPVGVAYRHKATKEVVELPPIELQEPESYSEAVELYGGEKDLLDYAFSSYVIEKQNAYREANRTDKEKDPDRQMVAAFKQLSKDKKEELLKAAGLL